MGEKDKIRTVIVDDESLGRDRIRKLLESYPDIELVAEASDGRQAVEVIRKEKPALLFLDVQMPELDGFGVLSEIQDAMPAAIVFVTAHDQFALKAFEVHAVDYLLKPFDRERFGTALNRAMERIKRNQPTDLDQRLQALIAGLQPQSKTSDRLAIKTSGRVILVKFDDIDWIEAADNYVSLHVGQETHLHRETMNAMAEQLPPNKFYRISRSTIVNVDRIKELQPLFHGEYSVILRNGARLTLSRSYRDTLQKLLGSLS